MDRFAALADPTRRGILEALAGGERSFGEIAKRFEMSPPAVSQHLRVLKRHGLVCVRAQAQRRYYRLDPAGLDAVDAWLDRVRRFWPERLDRLERQLREPEP